jgi:formate hydrogenlyase subunit 4
MNLSVPGILQGIFLLLLAPAFSGLVNYFKGQRTGYHRSPGFIFQPYRDMWKLFKLPVMRSSSTSWLFAAAPGVSFILYAWLAFIIPIFYRPAVASVDLIILVYVLGLARFVLSLAGLDSGTAFGSLGSTREMLFQFLSEIGLAAVLAALALQWNTLDLQEILTNHAGLNLIFNTANLPAIRMVFLIPALAALVVLETGRIPIDNPDTHLELTMSRKAIILEYAGRDLALMEWAEMIKLAFLATLLIDLFLGPFYPTNWPQFSAISPLLSFLLDGLLYLFFMWILSWSLGLWETTRPKLRLRKTSSLLWFSLLFSFITIVFIMLNQGAG